MAGNAAGLLARLLQTKRTRPVTAAAEEAKRPEIGKTAVDRELKSTSSYGTTLLRKTSRGAEVHGVAALDRVTAPEACHPVLDEEDGSLLTKRTSRHKQDGAGGGLAVPKVQEGFPPCACREANLRPGVRQSGIYRLNVHRLANATGGGADNTWNKFENIGTAQAVRALDSPRGVVTRLVRRRLPCS